MTNTERLAKIRALTFKGPDDFAPMPNCDCHDCTRFRAIRKLATVSKKAKKK